MAKQSVLNDPQLALLLLAVLVDRLGGQVQITQADVNIVAYNRLDERLLIDNSVEFTLIKYRRAD